MKKRIPNSYSAFPSSVNMRYGKRMSNGGAMNQLTEFNEGGRHEENGLGGIPQGMNEQGQMNLVEEGETKFNAENYIFSDTLKIDKELAKAFNLNSKMVGKTFADASKLAGRKKSRREGDKIEEAANDADLMNLMEAQEAFKQKEIEERLAEIDALDPTVLPAMMGQGQSQGDPAMGGQMQEAPMDEQAMMEQQMMAEQGQPSPEEMAMMQQQQDMAMGQQEGMMRSGGKIPKSVLLSRAKSHMSDAAAQEYVKNYDNGGNLGGPYPRHSIGLGYKRPVYPMTEEEARRQKIYEGPYKDHVERLNDIDLAFDNPTALVTGEPLAGEKSLFKDYLKWWDSPQPYRPTRKDEWPEAEKLGGYLGDGKSSFGGGGYMSRSYAPGGFMGMNMANAGMMNANPNPCGDPPLPPCPGQETGFTSTIKTRDTGSAIQNFSPHLSWTEEAGFEDDRIMQDIRQNMISNLGAVGTSTDPAYGGGTGIGEFPDKERTRKFKDFVGKVKDDFVDKRENIKAFRQKPNTAGRRYTHMNRALNVFRPKNDRIRNSGNMRFAVKHPRATQDAQGNNLRALSNLFLGVPDKSKWVGRFGEDQMRRGGGKLCYGCGGKMHAYGGRMSVPGVQHKYGAGMQTAGTILDTAADFAKYIPVVGQIVAPVAEAGANVLKGAGEAKATDTAYTLKDAAFDAGSGAAGTFVPGAEQFIQTIGDQATKKDKEAEMAKKQAILADKNHPDHKKVKAAMEARANDESLQNAQTFQNVWNQTAGMASQFINPGEAADTAATVTEVAPDAITDTVTDTTGLVGEGMGYGNWADIDMGAPELPFGTGGRMGSNYLKNGGGLWANIRAKKERMGKNYRPAKPGDKDYPSDEAIEAAQKPMGGSLTNPTDPMNIEPLPLMPANQFGSPAQATLPFNYAYNMQPTSIADFFQGENEINVDVDQEDVNRDFKFKETPMQAAAKALPIAANLYSGLFSKYDPKYEPEFVATKAPKLDYTESVNAIRRSTAGLRKDLRKFGRNPGNLQVAAQKGAQLEAQAIQQVDTINAKLQFEAEKLNKAEKQKLERMKKQLMLTFDEAKRKSLQASAEQTKQMVEANQANELAAYYATMAGEGIGSVEYKTLADQFAEMLKNRNKNKKKK